jgi:hypothetical protein
MQKHQNIVKTAATTTNNMREALHVATTKGNATTDNNK